MRYHRAMGVIPREVRPLQKVVRGPWVVAAFVAGLLALAVPVGADSSCDTPIRVLLELSRAPVEIVSGGRNYRIETDGPTSIRVNGQVAEGWRGEWASTQSGDRPLPGIVEVRPRKGQLAVIAELPLEQYVGGALHGEMPALWGGEALRAQAVVSRTYALHERSVHAERAYHLESGTRSQVFRPNGVPDSIRRAVEATRCEVLSWREAPILAVFHSASGGQTASAGEVWGRDLAYLRSIAVKREHGSPDTYWQTEISRTTLERVVEAEGRAVGSVLEAEIVARSESGRVREIRLRGSGGEVSLSGRQLRAALGTAKVRSTLFEIEAVEGGFVLSGSGSGHGVGMSQWGARRMALDGALYPEILVTFYPGTQLRSWGGDSVGPIIPRDDASARLGMGGTPFSNSNAAGVGPIR